MPEIILNIYLIINNNFVEEFRAVSYKKEGSDNDKIDFLKSKVKSDYNNAVRFDSPTDNKGKFMNYNKFYKLEKKGRHFELFESIFSSFDVSEKPLVCVTPVVDGKIIN
ncbi:MAG: hypothetical protein CO128_08705 [Ignavibacteriales bacterium CG_4_9_14_3_um_filter_30_11]|nr:MAG: hypothetical protein CO128_08705 [Ignavibacteriales bacterium CG_4_9_14_3_um_filter_30_11]